MTVRVRATIPAPSRPRRVAASYRQRAHVHLHEAAPPPGAAAAEDPIAAVHRRFMGRWLESLDRYYATIEAVSAGVDPATGAAFSDVEAATGPARSKAAAQLVVDWHVTIEEEFTAAHRLGVETWPAGHRNTGPRVLSDVVKRNIAKQKQFAFNFAMDVARGVTNLPGRMDAGLRSAMYGSALGGAYQRGTVDGSPDGMLMYWVLGITERHCPDCPVLAANSPYTRETAPCSPGDGSTACLTRCRCNWSYEPIATPAPPTAEETAQADAAEIPVEARAQGTLPTPPPGYRLPTEAERTTLEDLELRRNFAERRAARAQDAGDDAERDKWLKVMKECTARTIDVADSGKIFWVKTFSGSDVLRSADIRSGNVSFLTHVRGIDGTTVSRVQAEARRQAMNAAKTDAEALIRSLPAKAGAPVPSFRELLKLAGAPAGIFDAAPEPDRAADLEYLTDAASAADDAPVIPDPGVTVTYSVVGMGGAATLRLGAVLLAVLASKPDPYADVRVGPVGDGWPALALLAGMWVEGPAGAVSALLAETARRFKGRGVAAVYWTP